MNNEFKEIDIKNHTYCFFYDMFNTENLDPNKIKMKSHRKIFFFYYIGYVNGQNGTKSEILLDQKLITQAIMIKDV